MLNTKYEFNIPSEFLDSDINRLTNQLWKLIPMKEKNENWRNQIKTVIIEIIGLKNILMINDNFLILLSKLEGLEESDVEFAIYRKTVFESISILREIYNDIKKRTK